MNKVEMIRGAVWGLLVGDAMGVPYEFSTPLMMEGQEVSMHPPSSWPRVHQVPDGTWSDDGALSLCLLDSLLYNGNTLDLRDYANRAVNWYLHGYMAVDNRVFDVGGQTRFALDALSDGVSPLRADSHSKLPDGNGGLMRVLPYALLCSDLPYRQFFREARDLSALTHKSVVSEICCGLYCLWARNILNYNDNSWNRAVDTARHFLTTEEMEILDNVILNKDWKPSGSAFVVNGLRLAVRLSRHGYKEAVEKAILLGGDTDTNASIVGGITGLFYGEKDIPKEWKNALRGKELVESLLAKV